MNHTNLTDLCDSLTDDDIKAIYNEYMGWVKNQSLPEEARLRSLTKNVFGNDNVIYFDNVAKRIFQEGTRRWIYGG